MERLHVSLCKKGIGKEFLGKMNGNLTYILRLTLILLPGMLKSATQKCKVIISQHLNTVTYDSSITLTVLHKVYLHLTMPVHGICMLLFMAFYQMIAIFFRETRNL
jgi:hypothetical protein